MHAAAYCGDAECIGALVQAGGKVNVKDCNWLTPLHYAAARGHDVRNIEAPPPPPNAPTRLTHSLSLSFLCE